MLRQVAALEAMAEMALQVVALVLARTVELPIFGARAPEGVAAMAAQGAQAAAAAEAVAVRPMDFLLWVTLHPPTEQA